jgi:acyl dehydratase
MSGPAQAAGAWTFNAIPLGARLETAITVTETHLVMATGLFADFNPMHMNEVHAAKTRFGGRIAQGTLTLGLMASVIGNTFYGSSLAALEANFKFKGPVLIGDTITTVWEVTEKKPTRTYDGGVITLTGTCVNQRGELVAEGIFKDLVLNYTSA